MIGNVRDPRTIQGKVGQLYNPTFDDLERAKSRSSPSSSLRLGADYSQGGEGMSIGSLAVIPLRGKRGDAIERAFYQALRKHVPGTTRGNAPEVHMKDMWGGRARANNQAFCHLSSVSQIRGLIKDIALQLAEVIPFSVVAVCSIDDKDSKKDIGTALIAEAVLRVDDLLAQGWTEIVGRCPLLLDRGDDMGLIVPTRRGELARLVVEHLSVRGVTTCEPVPEYVESHEHAIVQAADFVAFAGLRLMHSIATLAEGKAAPHEVENHNFWLDILNTVRSNVAVVHRNLPTLRPIAAWQDAVVPEMRVIVEGWTSDESNLVPSITAPAHEAHVPRVNLQGARKIVMR